MDSSPITAVPSSKALRDGMKDVAFGSIAGIASKFFEHPFDLCKVRLQSQVLLSEQALPLPLNNDGSTVKVATTARFNGPIDCLTQTWRNEGIRGLYRGLPAPIVGAMVENAILFLAYGQLQRLVRWSFGPYNSFNSTSATGDVGDVDMPVTHLMIAAAGAGCITSFFLTPIELVKCKMQVQMLVPTTPLAPPLSNSNTHIPRDIKVSQTKTISSLPGPLKILRNIIHSHGLRGLWLGQSATLVREAGGSAAWFGAKEVVAGWLLSRRSPFTPADNTKPLTRKDLRSWESAFSGAVAGVAYNVVLFPVDTIKSTMQTEEELRPKSSVRPGQNTEKLTLIKTARRLYAVQGIRGLYAGMGITIARSAPSSAMIFCIYDGLARRLS